MDEVIESEGREKSEWDHVTDGRYLFGGKGYLGAFQGFDEKAGEKKGDAVSIDKLLFEAIKQSKQGEKPYHFSLAYNYNSEEGDCEIECRFRMAYDEKQGFSVEKMKVLQPGGTNEKELSLKENAELPHINKNAKLLRGEDIQEKRRWWKR